MIRVIHEEKLWGNSVTNSIQIKPVIGGEKLSALFLGGLSLIDQAIVRYSAGSSEFDVLSVETPVFFDQDVVRDVYITPMLVFPKNPSQQLAFSAQGGQSGGMDYQNQGNLWMPAIASGEPIGGYLQVQAWYGGHPPIKPGPRQSLNFMSHLLVDPLVGPLAISNCSVMVSTGRRFGQFCASDANSPGSNYAWTLTGYNVLIPDGGNDSAARRSSVLLASGGNGGVSKEWTDSFDYIIYSHSDTVDGSFGVDIKWVLADRGP